MSDREYIIIGGSWDGRTLRIPDLARNEGYIKLSKRRNDPILLGESESPEEELRHLSENYIAWELTFRDTGGQVHQWNLLRHEDLSEAEAFGMIVDSYQTGVILTNLTTEEEA